jgi:hypothetical protein
MTLYKGERINRLNPQKLLAIFGLSPGPLAAIFLMQSFAKGM